MSQKNRRPASARKTTCCLVEQGEKILVYVPEFEIKIPSQFLPILKTAGSELFILNRRNEAPFSPKMRRQIFSRDEYKCQLCGNSFKKFYKRTLQAHHIIGRKYGGPNKVWNGATVCLNCHAIYHDCCDRNHPLPNYMKGVRK